MVIIKCPINAAIILILFNISEADLHNTVFDMTLMLVD